jgi:hypothetical protein
MAARVYRSNRGRIPLEGRNAGQIRASPPRPPGGGQDLGGHAASLARGDREARPLAGPGSKDPDSHDEEQLRPEGPSTRHPVRQGASRGGALRRPGGSATGVQAPRRPLAWTHRFALARPRGRFGAHVRPAGRHRAALRPRGLGPCASRAGAIGGRGAAAGFRRVGGSAPLHGWADCPACRGTGRALGPWRRARPWGRARREARFLGDRWRELLVERTGDPHGRSGCSGSRGGRRPTRTGGCRGSSLGSPRSPLRIAGVEPGRGHLARPVDRGGDHAPPRQRRWLWAVHPVAPGAVGGGGWRLRLCPCLPR